MEKIDIVICLKKRSKNCKNIINIINEGTEKQKSLKIMIYKCMIYWFKLGWSK